LFPQEMEKQVKLGRTRSIGLSNFNEEQIMAIWESAQIKPSNLQVSVEICDAISLTISAT